MKQEITLHPAQVTILRELLFKPHARFSELNTTDLSSDHFTFHVKALVDGSLISKVDDNYSLTPAGKEFANRFDVDSEVVKVEKQAKVGVNITCIKEEDGRRFFLLQQRLKQPYYGHWGCMTGKIKWGESVIETAKRELEEETGLTADLTMVGIKHKTDSDTNGNLLEDKFFFKFIGFNPKGELIENFEGGHNRWVEESEISKLSPVFQDLPEVFTTIENYLDTKKLTFEEKTYTVENF